MSPNEQLQRIIDEGRCIGCGLCASMYPTAIRLEQSAHGWLRPVASDTLSEQAINAVSAVCPGVVHTGADRQDPTASLDEVWGPVSSLHQAHATAPLVRQRGATGGVLTALSQFLLDTQEVAHVLHVTTAPDNVEQGAAHLSSQSQDTLNGISSLYGPAAPLTAVHDLLDAGEPFAVVAKPCDISALRRLATTDRRVARLVRYHLTMVCGGFMPPFGTRAFFARYGIAPEQIARLTYRHDGCPGPVRIELRSGEVIEKTYLEFWGDDASMWHLPWRCKICPDGTGEAADLAALDTWPGGSPNPATLESDAGVNGVIVRTSRGQQLFDAAVDAGYITRTGSADIEDLNRWQPHQVAKKQAVAARVEGMVEAGHQPLDAPHLRIDRLGEHLTYELKREQTEGTIARIAIGKHSDQFGADI